jgi:carboxyl-terminal processing protease
MTRFLLIVLIITVTAISCSKSDGGAPPLPQPTDSLQRINRWMLDTMVQYYLYSDNYSSYPSLSEKPKDFFKLLLNTQDKFSWASNGASIPPPRGSFDRYGFHFIMVSLPAFSTSQLLGIVTLSAYESPADNAGIVRGNYFTKINGITLTAANFENIKSQIATGNNLKLTMAIEDNGNWVETGVITLSPAYFEERPVYATKIFKKNSSVVGYIFYNSFAEFFDKDILDALDKIKAAQATELILDLRYNPGGSVASAAKISAAIANNLSAANSFAIYKGNKKMGTRPQSFTTTIGTSTNNYRKDFAQLYTAGLKLQKLYVLTSGATASAAEMIINNLRPYIDVIHIGEKTMGKNKAGYIIRDMRQPKQVQWYIQPMIYEIYNSSNQSGYENGLIPTHAVQEFSSLPLEDPGNPADALTGKALQLILGTNIVDTEILRTQKHFDISKEQIQFNSATERNEKVPGLRINR